MKVKANLHVWTTVFLVAVPLVIFFWIKQSGNLDLFFAWSQRNYLLFIGVLLVLKIAAMVYPPLPGGILTLGAIPVIGWVMAYSVDLLGSLIGSSFAYFIGKKYGYELLRKVFDESTVQRFRSVKIKPGREVESVFVLRILGGMVVEIVAYGSGLLGIHFKSFLIGSLFSHMLIGIPSYYLANNIFSTQNIFFSFGVLVLSILLLWKIKGRYFE